MNTRTNIVLDDALVAQAMARAGVKTKKAAIEAALKPKPDVVDVIPEEVVSPPATNSNGHWPETHRPAE